MLPFNGVLVKFTLFHQRHIFLYRPRNISSNIIYFIALIYHVFFFRKGKKPLGVMQTWLHRRSHSCSAWPLHALAYWCSPLHQPTPNYFIFTLESFCESIMNIFISCSQSIVKVRSMRTYVNRKIKGERVLLYIGSTAMMCYITVGDCSDSRLLEFNCDHLTTTGEFNCLTYFEPVSTRWELILF